MLIGRFFSVLVLLLLTGCGKSDPNLVRLILIETCRESTIEVLDNYATNPSLDFEYKIHDFFQDDLLKEYNDNFVEYVVFDANLLPDIGASRVALLSGFYRDCRFKYQNEVNLFSESDIDNLKTFILDEGSNIKYIKFNGGTTATVYWE